jgi:hypothetical protein
MAGGCGHFFGRSSIHRAVEVRGGVCEARIKIPKKCLVLYKAMIII